MSSPSLARRTFLKGLALGSVVGFGPLRAEETPPAAHPLDPILRQAHEMLALIRAKVDDYECFLTKQERIGDKLHEPNLVFLRVRNCKREQQLVVQPFSVYLKFVEPSSVKGQEALWVQGKNNEQLLARAGGKLRRFTPRLWLDPSGPVAMRGNRYPIYEVGIENLVVRLIEKGERDRKHGEVEVQLKEAKVKERACTLLEVKHPVERSYFDFHIAHVFVDKELSIPIRYTAYLWPEQEGQEPPLLEDYFYHDLAMNLDLEDADFHESNEEYGFE